MQKIVLSEKREKLTQFAKELFTKIVDIPIERRPDENMRTGIQILIREIGTRNLMIMTIFQPSEAAQFFAIEKAVRSETLCHATSQESEDAEHFKFKGSVTVFHNDHEFQCSVSGLKAEEDVLIAICLLAFALGKTVPSIIKNLKLDGGLLPPQFYNKNHYINEIISNLTN
jgi:hypothetical protein